MSASLASPATAAFSASIPSGLDVGPALMACAMCLPRYNTGNATDTMIGAFPDCTDCASAAGCNNSLGVHGSEVSWPQQASARIASGAARRNPRVFFLWLIRKLPDPLGTLRERLQQRRSPAHG